jgi:hypothetical protein
MTPRIDRRTLLLAGLGGVLAACGARANGVAPVGQQEIDDVGELPAPLSVVRPDPPATMAMVGDSITYMSTTALDSSLARTGLEVLTIDAQVGRRMTVKAPSLYPGVDVVTYLASTDPPDLWVIALGANDVGQYADAAGYDDQIHEVLRAVPNGAPLVWVNAWVRDRRAETETFNRTLAARIERRPYSLVADWFSHGEDEGVITGDGVHPTPAGIEVFAEVATSGVQELLTQL